MYASQTTAERPVAITSRKQPTLLSDQFSKIPKVSKPNQAIFETSYQLLEVTATTFRAKNLKFSFFLTPRKRPVDNK